MVTWKDKAAELSIPELIDIIWQGKKHSQGLKQMQEELRARLPEDIESGAVLKGSDHELRCKTPYHPKVIDREAARAILEQLGLADEMSVLSNGRLRSRMKGDPSLRNRLAGSVEYRKVPCFYVVEKRPLL